MAIDWNSPEGLEARYQAAIAEDAKASYNRDQACGGELGWCENCGSQPGWGIKHVSPNGAKLGGRLNCSVVLCRNCFKTVTGAAKIAEVCRRMHEFHERGRKG